MKKWSVYFLIVAIAFSCEDDNTCGISEYSDELYPSFYSYESKGTITVDFDSIGVLFSNEEVFYLDTATTLPLDMSGSYTDFIFYTDSTDYDFRLSYRKEILIENEDCDPVFRVFALESFSEELDSVPLQVLELSKLISPHVEIYF